MKRLIAVVLFHRDGERKKYEKKIGACITCVTRQFRRDHELRAEVSLIIKRRGSGRGLKKNRKARNTLLGTCLACLSRSRLPSRVLFFPIPISLPRVYFSFRRQCSPLPR